MYLMDTILVLVTDYGSWGGRDVRLCELPEYPKQCINVQN